MNKYTHIFVLLILVLWHERSPAFNVFPYSSHVTLASPIEESPAHMDSILKKLDLPPQSNDKPAYHQREQVRLI